MDRNILDSINEALSGMQQPKISTIDSDTNATSILMKSLANQVANIISIDSNWQKEVRYVEIPVKVSFDGVSEIDLSEIADLSNVESLFIWDDNTQQRIIQVDYDRFLYEKIRGVQRIYKRYCFSENKILFTTPFTENTTLKLFYRSDNFVSREDENGCTSYDRMFVNDTDTFLLPDYLLIQGLRWKWYSNKNLPNKAEEEQLFLQMIDKYENRDKANIVVDFGDELYPRNRQDEGVRFD